MHVNLRHIVDYSHDGEDVANGASRIVFEPGEAPTTVMPFGIYLRPRSDRLLEIWVVDTAAEMTRPEEWTLHAMDSSGKSVFQGPFKVSGDLSSLLRPVFRSRFVRDLLRKVERSMANDVARNVTPVVPSSPAPVLHQAENLDLPREDSNQIPETLSNEKARDIPNIVFSRMGDVVMSVPQEAASNDSEITIQQTQNAPAEETIARREEAIQDANIVFSRMGDVVITVPPTQKDSNRVKAAIDTKTEPNAANKNRSKGRSRGNPQQIKHRGRDKPNPPGGRRR